MRLFKTFAVATVVQVAMCQEAEMSSMNIKWPSQLYVTENFTVPRPAVAKLGPTAPGYIFFGISGVGSNTTSPMITTEDGQLIWRPETNIDSTNFHVQQYKNQSVLTYFAGNSDSANVGQFVVLDHTYTKIYDVCGGFLNITTESNETCKLNLHETRISPRNTLLTLGHNIRPANLTFIGGPENGWIIDNLVLEFDIPTSKLLFRWSWWEHRDELPISLSHNKIQTPNLGQDGTSKDKPYDFTHLNTVDMVGDGYLINSRYYWAVVRLDKYGHVEWFLEGSNGGNFSLPSNCHFSFQHDTVPHNITNTSMVLSMLDNANDQLTYPSNPSSGLELSVSLANFSVSLKRRLTDPEVYIATQQTGGYQRLPAGHALVDFAIPSYLREFDEDGNVVYASQLGPVNRSDVYRAYKKEWVGRPTTSPKVVAKPYLSGETQVWVSWNGATEVATWIIYAGSSPAALSEKVKLQKVYFETSVKIPGTYGYVQVKALDKNGQALGQSAVVAPQGAQSTYERVREL